jgi:hypothetical protein|tara:strand:+ start:1358 stop:1612 length:255 start_codon:yes stop_codon:yes gene_type:complete
MKTIKSKYINAYNIYLNKIEKRNHKFGIGNCIVCENKFNKTNGKHYYCSRECRIINNIYKDEERLTKEELMRKSRIINNIYKNE